MSTGTPQSAEEAAVLLDELIRLDVHLWLEGSSLRFRSKPGALTPVLRTRIATCRPSLIALLASRDVTADPGEGNGLGAHAETLSNENIEQLISWLRGRDIQLSVSDGKLKVNAPKGAVDDAVRAQIAAHRDELLRVFATNPPGTIEPVIVSRSGPLALSHTQQRLWFMKQMDPDSTAYNIPSIVQAIGSLDIRFLQDALDVVVERQESLRTRFVTVDGAPRCLVEPTARVMIELRDLTDLPEELRESQAHQQALEFMHQRFDISRCPLMRARIYRLADQRHWVVAVVDHIVADGLSIDLLLREWWGHYLKFSTGDTRTWPALPYQYIDYADWQRRRFAAGALEANLQYWKRQLSGLPAALQLPYDRPRPPVQTYVGARFDSLIAGEDTERLKALARREGATLFMVLLSAFQALLHRYTGEVDIPVGTAIANRGHSHFEHVVGFFANNIVMRGNLEGNPTVRETIRRTREVTLQGLPHDDMPFDVLVDAIAPHRNLDHSPLFQVLFVLQSKPSAAATVAGVALSPVVELALRTSRFDLALDAIEHDGEVTLHYEYNTDLFDRSTIERMALHYRALLHGYVSNPLAQVSAIPLLDVDEATRLAAWNDTSVPLDGPHTVHGLFEVQAALQPDSLAVRCDDRSISYAELDARASQLARYLRTLPLSDDRLVGIWMERGIDMVVALLGVLKAGCAYVPLDPAFPRERIAFMADDAALEVVVTQEALKGSLPAQGVHSVCVDSDWHLVQDAPADLDPRETAGSDLAYVIYTSGSTGTPKGVQLEHLGVVNFLRSMHREPGITSDDRLVSVTTLSFDIAGLEIFGPLCAGGTVVLAPRTTALDGHKLAGLLEESQATIMQATPATWRLLLDSGWRGRPGLKMLCGGEALPRELASRLLTLGGELWNLYGPTETTIWSTLCRVTDASRAISIGRPIANTTIHVLEPSGLPAPIGVPGELCIGGVGLARGYRNRRALTDEKFVMWARQDGAMERVYRTGDSARWLADGQLEFIGRRDHQVKVRGFRIELEEIEAVLATHPGVQHGIVTVREDSPGDQRLVAYVVPEPGAEVDAEQARATLRARLPEYMIPGTFVPMVALPLTPNGKIDRRALPPPVSQQQASLPVDDGTRSPTELRVAGIWRGVLRLDKIGLDQNFFDVGGHSLLLVRLQAGLANEFGIELPLHELFQRTTIASQAQRLATPGPDEGALKRARARAARQNRG